MGHPVSLYLLLGEYMSVICEICVKELQALQDQSVTKYIRQGAEIATFYQEHVQA